MCVFPNLQSHIKQQHPLSIIFISSLIIIFLVIVPTSIFCGRTKAMSLGVSLSPLGVMVASLSAAGLCRKIDGTARRRPISSHTGKIIHFTAENPRKMGIIFAGFQDPLAWLTVQAKLKWRLFKRQGPGGGTRGGGEGTGPVREARPGRRQGTSSPPWGRGVPGPPCVPICLSLPSPGAYICFILTGFYSIFKLVRGGSFRGVTGALRWYRAPAVC